MLHKRKAIKHCIAKRTNILSSSCVQPKHILCLPPQWLFPRWKMSVYVPSLPSEDRNLTQRESLKTLMYKERVETQIRNIFRRREPCVYLRQSYTKVGVAPSITLYRLSSSNV